MVKKSEITITDCKKDEKCVKCNGYKLFYTDNGMTVNTSNDRWQDKINKWKKTDKNVEDYKKSKDSICSLKNRVFSGKEWNIVEENWGDICKKLKIEHVDNSLEVYKTLTGDNDVDINIPEGNCLKLFELFEKSKENGKKFTKPKAEIYRLLVAFNFDKFCPIVNDDNLNDFIRLLQGQGYIESITDENDNDISLTKTHWCIKSALLRLFFQQVLGGKYNDVTPWNFYQQLKDTEVKDLLINNKNLILTGAPGTGKTYMARQIAAKMIGCRVEDLDSSNQFSNQFEFVQFHPSYDYTDFVEGLRPFKEQGNNNVHFELQYGTFKAFCEKAAEFEDEFKKEPDKHKYVFVIDEINRGEISKIFGELFFSIDPGYRKKEDRIPVKTQYQNLISNSTAHSNSYFRTGFYVPENVYIIGTMNDIDRSVESMDFAFRRRFAFKEVKAMDTADVILSQLSKDEDKAYKKLVAINDKLTELGLSDSYHIGAAYFRKLDLYNGNGKWKSLWDYHLYGTLYEYFRGEPDVDKKMKQLSEAYNNAEENN